MNHRRLLVFIVLEAVLWEGTDGTVCNSTAPGEVIVRRSGSDVLDWPEGPVEYPINQECYWLIVVPIGKVIRYKFTVLSVEDSDYVLVDGYRHSYVDMNFLHSMKTSAMGYTTLSKEHTLSVVVKTQSKSSGNTVDYDTGNGYNEGRFGFRIEYEVSDNECPSGGKNIYVSGSGVLDYPKDHDRYGHDRYCFWRVIAPEDKIFTYNITKMDVETLFDHLAIGENDTSEYYYIDDDEYPTRSSGYTSSNILNVHFYSDKQFMYSGFTLTWDLADSPVYSAPEPPLEPQTCFPSAPGKTISLESGGGVLDWPEGPAEYPINQLCYWLIMVPIGKVVRYKFNVLSFEYDDYVYVDTFRHTYETQYYLEENSGEKALGYETLSRSNNLTIKVSTHSSHSYHAKNYTNDKEIYKARFGFHMEYEVAENECPEEGKNITVTGSGILDYPADNNYYHFNSVCTWRLFAPEEKVLRYNITKMDLEDGWDFLFIYDSNTPVSTYTGHVPPSNAGSADGSFTTTSNVLTVALESDMTVHLTGFTLTWDVADRDTGSCNMCTEVSAACVNTYENITLSRCQCPAYVCSSLIENGCDVSSGCAPVGSPCDLDESVPCWDVNAECVLYGLSNYHVCTCRFGYVAVYNDGQPIRCHRRLSRVEDNECTVCIDNGGVCYDNADNEDLYADGCVCPPTRITNFTHCDTQLFAVSCTQDNMTVCYIPHSHISGQENITAMLDAKKYLLYAKGFLDDGACHFSRVDDKYCLVLGFTDKYCGLSFTDTTVATSYSAELLLQKDVRLQTSEDVHLLVYCTCNELQRVISSAIDVFDSQKIGFEGKIHQPILKMMVLNKIDQDLTETGLMIGDEMKIRLWISDTADLFTSLKAEVCVLSDRSTLNYPALHTIPIILHGCPVEPHLSSDDKFRTVGDDSSTIETGTFSAPKFPETSYIFVHCAVRVCLKDEECSLICGTDSRRRRSVTDINSYMTMLLANPSVQHKYLSVKYSEPIVRDKIPPVAASAKDESIEDMAVSAEDESIEDVNPDLLWWTWVTFVGVVVLVVSLAMLTSLLCRQHSVVTDDEMA